MVIAFKFVRYDVFHIRFIIIIIIIKIIYQMLTGHLKLNLILLKNVFIQLHHHINFKLYQLLTHKNFLLWKNNKILLKIFNFYLLHKTSINHHA